MIKNVKAAGKILIFAACLCAVVIISIEVGSQVRLSRHVPLAGLPGSYHNTSAAAGSHQ